MQQRSAIFPGTIEPYGMAVPVAITFGVASPSISRVTGGRVYSQHTKYSKSATFAFARQPHNQFLYPGRTLETNYRETQILLWSAAHRAAERKTACSKAKCLASPTLRKDQQHTHTELRNGILIDWESAQEARALLGQTLLFAFYWQSLRKKRLSNPLATMRTIEFLIVSAVFVFHARRSTRWQECMFAHFVVTKHRNSLLQCGPTSTVLHSLFPQ